MKTYVYLLLSVYLLFLSILISSYAIAGTLLDKPVIRNLDGCYNLTLTYDLVEGNMTPVYFKDCKDLGNQTWFCDCKNVELYNLTMRTDNAMIREAREYEFEANINLYDVCSDRVSFDVNDWGDYVDFDKVNPKCSKSKSDEVQVFYINRTVEVPVIEYRDVVKEVIKEVPVIVNVTSYVENRTSLDRCLNNIEHNNKSMERAWIISSSVLLIGLIIIVVMFVIARGKNGREQLPQE